MNNKTVIGGVLAILIVGALVGGFIFRSVVERPSFGEITVGRGDIEDTLNLEGQVKSENEADLGFESGGKIMALTHKVGDTVTKNEVLARSNSSDLSASYQESQALLASAEANLEYYQKLLSKEKNQLHSLERTGAKLEDKNAQKSQVAASQAQVAVQAANVEAAQAAVRSVQAQIEKTVIRAPFSGVLAKQDVEVGEVAGSGNPILTVINEGNFKVEALASQIDVQNIKVGDSSQITLDNKSSETFPARVSAVDPMETLENGVPAYKVTFEFENQPENLKSGTVANVKITIETKNQVILVPAKAIYTEGNQQFVYTSASGVPQKREVSLGIHGDDGQVEILSGLSEGDKIFKLTE